jgi:hypothetical protein
MSSCILTKITFVIVMLLFMASQNSFAGPQENCTIDISYTEVDTNILVKSQYKYRAETKKQCLEYRDIHSIQFSKKIKNKRVTFNYKSAK